MSESNGNGHAITKPLLPENLPAGAKAFQAAVDNKLTQDIWSEILDSQITKAKKGDRGAAKFLLEYAGGVASLRGATFVQEHHHHNHYHEGQPTQPTTKQNGVNGAHRLVDSRDAPVRTPEEFARDRNRAAHRIAGTSE